MFGIDSRIARYTWTAVALLLLLVILFKIRDTLFVFVVGLLFAYLLWPLFDYLDRRLPGHSRAPALAIIYVALVGLMIFGVFEIGSRVLVEANTLATKLPEILSRVSPSPQGPLVTHSAEGLRRAMIVELRRQIAEHSREIVSSMPKAAIRVIAAVRILLFIVLVPVLSFFFLKDGAKIRELFLTIIPEGPRRRQLQEIGDDLHVLLAQYMRALFMLAGLAFGAYGLFFSIVKVPYAILLAAVAFPLEFIPMVGPFVAFVIIMLVAIFAGYHHLLWILLFMGAFRIFQDYVISPQIMSSEMKLHPVVVIFGVLAGAELAGIIGSFLSVPVLAVLRIVYIRLRRRRLVIVQTVPPSATSE